MDDRSRPRLIVVIAGAESRFAARASSAATTA